MIMILIRLPTSTYLLPPIRAMTIASANPPQAKPNHPASKHQLDSHALLGPTGAVLIKHEGCVYCLRRTRQGKLILTK